MVPASIKGKYIIRYTVTSQYTTVTDIERDWGHIRNMASSVLNDETLQPVSVVVPRPISTAGQMKREGLFKKDFGISLILSNVPMSPKFINGSFAALFEANDIIVEFARDLGRDSIDMNGHPIRLSPRKRLKEHSKQYSFDLCMVPTGRKTLRPPKQGSLDSKIEEIFDTSIDSDLCDTDTEPSIGFDLNDREAKKTPSWETVAVDSQRLSPDPCIPTPTSKATRPPVIQTELTADHVTDKDAASPDETLTIVNGIPHMFCKHCGHPIEFEQ
jgi:histidine decarboxylase